MKQNKDTTGVNFQMENQLYSKMKIKLALNKLELGNLDTIKDYIIYLVEKDLNTDKRTMKE